MSQYAFGTGNMYVTPLTDARGNAIANPTPMPLMTLQDGAIDFSGDVKELYGQNQFAQAVGRGKVKMTVKVKPARIFAAVWNAMFFGQTLNSGLMAVNSDTQGQVVPSTGPYAITVAPPLTGTFVSDAGVIDGNGDPMVRVASSPITGQYSLNVLTGVYTFASADSGKTVYINYMYSATAGVGKAQKMTVQNLPMGYAPTFKADLTVAYLGKLTTMSFRRAMPTKMSIGFKNEDFAIPEFDFSAFDDGTGNILDLSTSE
ncbi:hypothetical protein [Polynucleobacter sp. AP-RePozz3-80-G7]|uniref:hypothetical protein n=1 Tax=Polynucleobacter sp. AP-RePozz3-80-G7 TaxID=2689105 RepID=UPI001C0CFAD9|nr:hypothetical protein [Polynucleobacter sp. AP-RePozz3-80-G7]MBU3640014.1 hypothetical protein [Polynucleobacter sp. AP-RePozz3-80-G7]